MKNFKLLAVVAVVLVAGSAFAFFNGEPKPVNKAVNNQTYYHIGQSYVPMSGPPSGLSCEADDKFCTVTLQSEDDLPATFNEDALESIEQDPNITVTGKGQANRSWQ